MIKKRNNIKLNDQTSETELLTNGTNARVHKESPNNDILREMVVQKIKEKMKTLQTQIITEVDKKLNYLTEEVLNEVKQLDIKNNELEKLFNDGSGDDEKLANRKKSERSGVLPEKVFIARNSLLIDLFEVKHIRTIYHIFIVSMIILVMNTTIYDFVADGTINLGFKTIFTVFGNFHIALGIWIILQLYVFCVHPAIKIWSFIRQKINNGKCILDGLSLIFFIIFQIFILTFAMKSVIRFNLDKASSAALLMESVRFVMKIHSFIRTIVPRILYGKEKIDDNIKVPITIPLFTQYLYFLFAPTLIYRDSYPRTKKIRWNFAAKQFLEVFGVIFYLSFIFERFLIHTFKDFGTIEIQPKELVLMIFQALLSGMLIFVCCFYCLLHAWHNGTSELLRFADRMFYKDWWNASSFDVYYRTWNIIVHDWLYTYIYKDIYENVCKGSKFAATLITFSISAIIHEIIIGFTFRFFYPVLFMFFEGTSIVFVFLNSKKYKNVGSIFMWFCLCFGNGLINALYSMEISARRNCPVENTLINYIIPVSWDWKCNGIVSDPNWKMVLPWQN